MRGSIDIRDGVPVRSDRFLKVGGRLLVVLCGGRILLGPVDSAREVYDVTRGQTSPFPFPVVV